MRLPRGTACLPPSCPQTLKRNGCPVAVQPLYGFLGNRDAEKFVKATGHPDLYFIEDRVVPLEQVPGPQCVHGAQRNAARLLPALRARGNPASVNPGSGLLGSWLAQPRSTCDTACARPADHLPAAAARAAHGHSHAALAVH